MQNYGKFMETPIPQLEHESKMRLLKTHSHTSERQGNEAVKYVKKKTKGGPSLKGQEEIVKAV